MFKCIIFIFIYFSILLSSIINYEILSFNILSFNLTSLTYFSTFDRIIMRVVALEYKSKHGWNQRKESHRKKRTLRFQVIIKWLSKIELTSTLSPFAYLLFAWLSEGIIVDLSFQNFFFFQSITIWNWLIS